MARRRRFDHRTIGFNTARVQQTFMQKSAPLAQHHKSEAVKDEPHSL
jgi:hypothetical protein